MRPGTRIRWIALKDSIKSEIKNDALTIDLGGYDGVISQNLKILNPNLTLLVLDTDLNGLRVAKSMKIDAICASALNIPLQNDSSKNILCLDLIEHVSEDEDLIKEISRVLVDNGLIILTTPMENGVNFPFLPKKYGELINKKWGHIRKGYSFQELKNLLQRFNLKIIKKGGYFNYFSRFFYWLRYLTKKPSKISDFLFKYIIKLEPYMKYKIQEHIIIAKKRNKIE